MRLLRLREALLLLCVFVSLSNGQRSVETIDLAGSRYFISQTSPYVPTLNWFLAYQYCRTIGMELLSIGTAEEAELITSYLAANRLSNTDYWTSGNQLGSHHWMWMATGERFNGSFNYWAAEEPFASKQGHMCMSVSNGAWVPQSCMDEKYFICELTRCFFVNFVSASRSSPQGALPTTPRITPTRNRSPHRTTTRPSHHSTHQQRQQQQQQQQQHRTTASQTHTQTSQPSPRFPQPIVTPSRGVTTTTTQDATTYEDGDTFPTTLQPLKTMQTATQDEQIGESTTIPQTGRVKIMPGVSLDIEPEVHNNEIIHARPVASLRLLVPPTREFSPSPISPSTSFFSPSSSSSTSFSPSPSPSSFSSSSVPLQAEASTNFTVRRPLSRKETFSWAFLDQRSK